MTLTLILTLTFVFDFDLSKILMASYLDFGLDMSKNVLDDF